MNQFETPLYGGVKHGTTVTTQGEPQLHVPVADGTGVDGFRTEIYRFARRFPTPGGVLDVAYVEESIYRMHKEWLELRNPAASAGGSFVPGVFADQLIENQLFRNYRGIRIDPKPIPDRSGELRSRLARIV